MSRMGIVPKKLKTNNEIMNTEILSNESETPILRIGAVMPRFSSVLSLFDGICLVLIVEFTIFVHGKINRSIRQ